MTGAGDTLERADLPPEDSPWMKEEWAKDHNWCNLNYLRSVLGAHGTARTPDRSGTEAYKPVVIQDRCWEGGVQDYDTLPEAKSSGAEGTGLSLEVNKENKPLDPLAFP